MKFLPLFLLFFLIPPAYAQLRPGQIGTNTVYFNPLRPGIFGEAPAHARQKNDLIETLPLYHSYINWTRGELVTEYTLPITYEDPNVGRSVVNATARLKEELLVYAARALGLVKASSFLTLEDYFTRDETIRNGLLASLYSLPVENVVIEKSMIRGTLLFPLYGTNSISLPFYQNTKSGVVTNYLTRNSLDNYYDTLIIDLVMFPAFNPSLMPRILNQNGELVHGVETMDPALLRRQGPVHYVTSITEALNHPVRGKKAAYIMPAEIGGSLLSDIILFESDVGQIFSQQRSLDAFRQGRVIIIQAQK